MSLRSIAGSCRACALWLALRSPELGSSTTASRVWHRTKRRSWSRAARLGLPSAPAAMPLGLRRHASALPPAIRERLRPDTWIRRHVFAAESHGVLGAWLARRLSHVLEHQVCGGKVESVVTRLTWAFRDQSLACTCPFGTGASPGVNGVAADSPRLSPTFGPIRRDRRRPSGSCFRSPLCAARALSVCLALSALLLLARQ